MSDPMADIMSADEKIDALPPIGVKDLYVRSKLMEAAMEGYTHGPGSWETDGFKKAEQALTYHSHDGVRTWALNDPKMSEWVDRVALDNRAEDFTVEVFDRITTDGWSEDRTLAAARGWLKKKLSGSLGMPDDKVIRENLKNYAEGEN